MKSAVTLFVFLGYFSASAEKPHSCADIYKSDILQLSGVFTIYNRQNQAFQVYCDFKKGFGYTYISPSVSVDVNIQDLFTNTSHVLIRDLRTDGTQHESRIEQIAAFKNTPLSIQFNSYTGYQAMVNSKMTPFVYVGLIPKNRVGKGHVEGYKINGRDVTFTNCDGNGNSYFSFLFNHNHVTLSSKGPSPAILHQWDDLSKSIPASQNIPDSFFSFFELHFGGCGAYGTLRDFPNLKGTAVGIRYDITCPTPVDIGHAQKTLSGLKPGSTVTYNCDVGFTMLTGTSTRTCAQTGKWTGVTPFCGKFPCETGPCHNGGSCFEIEGSQFICECSEGFTGTFCERKQ